MCFNDFLRQFLGDICLIAFCLLPFILPSCGRKLTAGSDSEDEENGSSSGKRSKQGKKNRKRQCSVKASDIESLRSMIVFRSVIYFILVILICISPQYFMTI